jgi:hypothetical protein
MGFTRCSIPGFAYSSSKQSQYIVMKQCLDRTPGSVTKRSISHVGAVMRINCGSRRNLARQKYAMTGIGPRNQ